MHPDVDDLFKERIDASAAIEGLVAGWLKRAGYYVTITPEHSGESDEADMYLRRMIDGKLSTVAAVEVKSRNLSFHSPGTFPYDTVPLVLRKSHKPWRDYVVVSASTHRAIVSPADGPRIVTVQSDRRRGVAGPVYSARREDMIPFSDWLDLVAKRTQVGK